jgi:hypothetical protein
MAVVIRHWKTRTRLQHRSFILQGAPWVSLYNKDGNVMFYGTKALFDACVQRGFFEFEEV